MRKVTGLLSLNHESLRSVTEIETNVRQLYVWALENVVGNDVFPRELPRELSQVMNQISEHCQKISARIMDENNLKSEVISEVIFADKRAGDTSAISEEYFYFSRSLGAFTPADGDCCEYSIHVAKCTQREP